jgi:hypothetical protein
MTHFDIFSFVNTPYHRAQKNYLEECVKYNTRLVFSVESFFKMITNTLNSRI